MGAVVEELSAELQGLNRDYVLHALLGSGSYGQVAAGKHKPTGDPIAAKRVLEDILSEGYLAQRIYREIQVMQHLHWTVIGEHRAAHFVTLRELIVPSSRNFESFWMIMELCDCDLRFVFGQGNREGLPGIEMLQARYIIFQLFHALKTMKDAHIIHRDIQAANVLINCESLDIKVCDFGMSREYTGGDMNSNVVMQWYRAPELLMKSDHYDYQIDVWGAGCILGDLLALRGHGRSARKISPLFKCQPVGNEESLEKILSLLGVPSPADLEPVPKRYEPSRKGLNLMRRLSRNQTRVDWWAHFAISREDQGTEEAVEILDQLLVFNPLTRKTVEWCLARPWFADLHRLYTAHELAHDGPVPPFHMLGGDCHEDNVAEWKNRMYELAQKSHDQGSAIPTMTSPSMFSSGECGASPTSKFNATGGVQYSHGATPLAVPDKRITRGRAGSVSIEPGSDAESEASLMSHPPPSPSARLLALIGGQLEHGGEDEEIRHAAVRAYDTSAAVRPALLRSGWDPGQRRFTRPMKPSRWQNLAVRIRKACRSEHLGAPGWIAPENVAPLRRPSTDQDHKRGKVVPAPQGGAPPRVDGAGDGCCGSSDCVVS
eukprot:TRINITY_DN19050_c1_g1_i1.p2 TRINITY_DN19050_c1_g1~~TRINITY_DN19050_c1_g1_i1.p2  ORF type:complete len:602 (+),score=185.01 TRINITY_DN19050_c1_g1_i1:90-1895(+)